MKQWFNIAVLAVLVGLMACTKIENTPEQERAISYAVGSYAQATKATPLNDPSGENITSFSSKAWLHTAENPSGSLFFTETVSYDGTSQWLPSHEYYWPKNSTNYINFVSWYDKNAALGSANAPAVTETSITWTNRTIVADDNILVADKAWQQKANLSTYTAHSGTNGVPTLFRHMLAQVLFEVASSPVTEDDGTVTTVWATELSNFVLHGVHTTGSLSLTTPGTSSTDPYTSEWTGSWEASTDPTTVVNISGEGHALNETPYPVIPLRSVMPQEVSGIYISFDYVIVTTSVNNADHDKTHVLRETMNSGDIYLSSFNGYNDDWVKNKKITYTVNITAKSGAIAIVPTITTIDNTLTLNVE